MITGVVTSDREAVIRLTVRGPRGRQLRIEAIIDTGFDGWLSLPRPLIASLKLPWKRRGRALLADGSETVFDIFEATVTWHQRTRRISVDEAASAPLVGMALLSGSEVNTQVRTKGKVTIKPLGK
jgi:clan AA aspartic protease